MNIIKKLEKIYNETEDIFFVFNNTELKRAIEIIGIGTGIIYLN
ncbi:MAG: hypothetical protein ACFFG0_46215 [Candidatus Thorarchaeota archaeon]